MPLQSLRDTGIRALARLGPGGTEGAPSRPARPPPTAAAAAATAAAAASAPAAATVAGAASAAAANRGCRRPSTGRWPAAHSESSRSDPCSGTESAGGDRVARRSVRSMLRLGTTPRPSAARLPGADLTPETPKRRTDDEMSQAPMAEGGQPSTPDPGASQRDFRGSVAASGMTRLLATRDGEVWRGQGGRPRRTQ